MNRHNWTETEEYLLRSAINSSKSMHETEKILGLNRSTIKTHINSSKELKELCIKKGFFRERRSNWTEREIIFVSENLYTMTLEEMSVALNRTRNAILKAIRTNHIRITKRILSITADLEAKLDQVEKEIMDGHATEAVISERNKLICAIEARKSTCRNLKSKMIKTIAILR